MISVFVSVVLFWAHGMRLTGCAHDMRLLRIDIRWRAITMSALSGLLVGLIVAGIMTFVDWRANPGGIFRDAAGTHWRIVLETAWTWAWPVTLLVAAILLPVGLVCHRVRRRR